MHPPQKDQDTEPQSSPQTIPVAGSPIGQVSTRRSSKWLYFFLALTILQVIGVVLFFLIMTWAIGQAKAGVSGTEYIGLILLTTLVPAIGIMALVNLVGLPVLMIKRKLRGMKLVFSILSLVVSVVLASYGVYIMYQMQVVIPNKEKEFSEQLRKESERRERQSDF